MGPQEDARLEELIQLFTKTTLLPLINDLPMEIKWLIIDYAGVNSIQDAISLASSSKAFRNAWNSRTDTLYTMLTQDISPTVLPAALLAAAGHRVDDRLYKALLTGEDVVALFESILVEHNDLQVDRAAITSPMARDIQEMGRQVEQLTQPFQHRVPGHNEDAQLGVGLALPTSETEMDRIKRAHYILEYLKTMHLATGFIFMQLDPSDFHTARGLQNNIFSIFSEIELRQVSQLVRITEQEIDNLFEKCLGIYQRRLCCGVPREGICPSVKRIAWELTMTDRLTLKDAEARKIPSKRIMKLIPFGAYLGHDLKSLSRVYNTNGMLHQTPQGDAPGHPHRVTGIQTHHSDLTQIWISNAAVLRHSPRFTDSDSGPEDLISWHEIQLWSQIPQVLFMREKLRWNILTGFTLEDIEDIQERWSSSSLLWYDRARLEQLTHGQLPTDI